MTYSHHVFTNEIIQNVLHILIDKTPRDKSLQIVRFSATMTDADLSTHTFLPYSGP